MTSSKPPAGLGSRGRSLWRAVTSGYVLDPAELAMLAELCRTLDEIDALTAALKGEPLTVVGSTGQPRPHPLLAELREHRKVSERLSAALALPVGGETVGRRRSAQAKSAADARWRRSRATALRSPGSGA